MAQVVYESLEGGRFVVCHVGNQLGDLYIDNGKFKLYDYKTEEVVEYREDDLPLGAVLSLTNWTDRVTVRRLAHPVEGRPYYEFYDTYMEGVMRT